jgi:simple sugar transport system ATP-binding protein
MGLRSTATGRVVINGRDVTRDSIAQRRESGVSYIAEDRVRTASAAQASASHNLVMGFQRRPPLAAGAILRLNEMRRWARALIDQFGIKIASEATRVGTLSGGNLQKVVVARELAHDAGVLIAEQPTRGVDVGAIEFLHAQLLAERARGHAILLVSAELSEILVLSDRILVMYEGRIVAELAGTEADEVTLGLYMTGDMSGAA